MTNASERTVSRAAVAAALALALLAVPLTACGGQAAQGGGSSSAAEQTQSVVVDVSSWKTLGDALAYDNGENNTAGWDEKRYITVFSTDGPVVRVVAKMDAETYEKLGALDATDEGYNEKFLEVMGGLPLESAEDLTDQKVTQDELDAYVGKTGQDLVDDGFAFESYWMYGGDETGAVMAKGPLAYNVTFDVSIPDEKAGDGGASIMGATITDAVYAGASMDATDPSTL
ncbi:MAG: hypothetical protein IJ111_06805 [Eggerthellaceae bacterium]|nr:hypothetical protein [Eggerthellaceae bacterium]